MTISATAKSAVVLASVLFASPFAISPAASAIVDARYQGEINLVSTSGSSLPAEMQDLVGKVLEVDFSYDVGALPLISLTPDSHSAIYGHGDHDLPLLANMTITVGTLVWNWDPLSGGAFAEVTNNWPGANYHDSFSFSATTFTGPAIFDSPVEYSSFGLFLWDRVPETDPDGVSSIFPLPSTAPNPSLFTGWFIPNRMSFTLTTADGTEYLIETQSVLAAPIPEPTTLGLFATGLFALVGGVAFRGRVDARPELTRRGEARSLN